MTPTGLAVAEDFRRLFSRLAPLDPDDVDQLVLAIIGHIRQLRPERFGALSKSLPAPTEKIVDPREVTGP